MKKNKRIIRMIALLMIVLFVLSGCSRGRTILVPVWPDGWTVGKNGDQAMAGESSSGDAKTESSQSTADSKKTADYTYEYDNFYPDLSRSAGAYADIDRLYRMVKSAEGGEKLRYWGVDPEMGQLTQIDYKKIFGVKDFDRSPLDYLMTSDATYSNRGANILVTDMMSTTGSEFGEWLISTGSQAFSFYVFNMPFEGNIDFYGYPKASSTEIRHFHINSCVLNRDLLMVVFGAENRVSRFDESFRTLAMEEGLALDYGHISRMEKQESVCALRPVPCFKDNLPNIIYKIPEKEEKNEKNESGGERQTVEGNKTAGFTNFNYGLTTVEDPEIQFTLPETFLFIKSHYSANDNIRGVRAVFYGIPEVTLGRILKYDCSVLEYDKGQKSWKESEAAFEVEADAYVNGFPASPDAETNERLGGNIVEGKNVVAVKVENDSLSEGLYAVEASVIFEPAENAADLRLFADRHSAEVGDYLAAISEECTPQDDTNYILNGKGSRAFGLLLDFRGMIDELTASGFSDPASVNKYLTVRLIIDNR